MRSTGIGCHAHLCESLITAGMHYVSRLGMKVWSDHVIHIYFEIAIVCLAHGLHGYHRLSRQMFPKIDLFIGLCLFIYLFIHSFMYLFVFSELYNQM